MHISYEKISFNVIQAFTNMVNFESTLEKMWATALENDYVTDHAQA